MAQTIRVRLGAVVAESSEELVVSTQGLGEAAEEIGRFVRGLDLEVDRQALVTMQAPNGLFCGRLVLAAQ